MPAKHARAPLGAGAHAHVPDNAVGIAHQELVRVTGDADNLRRIERLDQPLALGDLILLSVLDRRDLLVARYQEQEQEQAR